MSDARIIALIAAGHMVSHFLQLTIPPLFPLLKSEFDVSWVALGLVSSVFYGVSGVMQTVSGFFVDRLGARRVLLAGMTLFGGAIAAAGLASSYWMLLPIAAVAGVGNSVFHPADYSMLNGSVSAGRIARGYSAHAILGSVGFILGPRSSAPSATSRAGASHSSRPASSDAWRRSRSRGRRAASGGPRRASRTHRAWDCAPTSAC